MATKTKSAVENSKDQATSDAVNPVPAQEPGVEAAAKVVEKAKELPSKYPPVRVLSGSELDAYKNQKVDVEKAERFLAQKDKEEYWRNKKEQKRKKSDSES